MMDKQYSIFSSESVSEGHPDKVCDTIADSILDACLEQDAHSHVACEVLAKSGQVILAGEISTNANFEYDQIVRDAIREIGYIDNSEAFSADNVKITNLLSKQSHEINNAVDNGLDQGAGDQGIMFGFASDETPELMPLPIKLAHNLAYELAVDRKSGKNTGLRPDSKTQVSVRYEGIVPVLVDTVLVSTQHTAGYAQADIKQYVATVIAPRALGEWFRPDIKFIVNPSGSFEFGGPTADCGVTGRKIIVDTYGGAARHGGGAFSGKDPSKVDRSSAYFCRYVAREIIKAGLAKKAELQVAYAIGQAQPVSVLVDTFGTGESAAAEEFVRANFDFRPAAIIERLGLLKPIYKSTTNYGHFGKSYLPWEM
ncbi:MAG: methionine adenosyltransferase [Armatimonadota bacterium]